MIESELANELDDGESMFIFNPVPQVLKCEPAVRLVSQPTLLTRFRAAFRKRPTVTKPEIESIDDTQLDVEMQKLKALVEYFKEKEKIEDRYVVLFLAFGALQPGVTKWKVQ